MDNDVFFSKDGYKGYVESVLLYKETQVTMAVDPTDDTHIFGFAVYEKPNILHYVYTKAPFRNLEVSTRLLSAAFPTLFGKGQIITTSSCRVWGRLASWNDIAARYGFKFNPFMRATAGITTRHFDE